MDELDKMRRTAAKLIPGAPHEVLLVMDATTGQNGLQQARQFTQSAGATGIVLTKLDGTAKGGIAVAIAQELNLPVRFAGVGEQMSDLLEFSPTDFVDSLLGDFVQQHTQQLLNSDRSVIDLAVFRHLSNWYRITGDEKPFVELR